VSKLSKSSTCESEMVFKLDIRDFMWDLTEMGLECMSSVSDKVLKGNKMHELQDQCL